MGFESGVLEAPRTTNPDREITPRNFEEQLRHGYYANIILDGYMGENTWSREHVARDILQNFFDANGQTLDGIQISVQERDGDAEVTIHGNQTYPYRHLISLGSGHKDNKNRAAGGKHQGTKDVAVMLLREYGVDAMEFRSDDWKLTFYSDDAPAALQGDEGERKSGLFLQLKDAKEKTPGNYLRFVTRDKEMVSAMLGARDLFFHKNNPDLQHPDMDTDFAGFRMLEKGEKGNIYLNGQRISYEEKGEWNTVPGFTFWSKVSPRVGNKSITLSRDRELLTHQDLGEVFIPFLIESMSREERELALFALEPYFEKQDFDFSRRVGQDLLIQLLVALKKDGFRTTFGDRYFADDTNGKGESEVLKGRGFILCIQGFADIGMRRASDFFKTIEKSQEVQPAPEERQRMELIEKIGQQFLDAHGKLLGLEAKSIRLFASAHPALGGKYDGQSLWVAQQKLRADDPFATLTIYFHELCHKFGNDQSAEFSYKLTDLLREWMHYCATHPTILTDLRNEWQRVAIDNTWKSLKEFESSAAPIIGEFRSGETGYTDKHLENHQRKIEYIAKAFMDIVETKFAGYYDHLSLEQIWRAIQSLPAVLAFHEQEHLLATPEYYLGLEAATQEKKVLNEKIWRKREALSEFERQQRMLEQPGKSVQKRGKKKAVQELQQRVAHLRIELQTLNTEYEALAKKFPDTSTLIANDRALEQGQGLLGIRCDVRDMMREDNVLSAWNRVLLATLPPHTPSLGATKRVIKEMQNTSLFFREQMGNDISSPRHHQRLLTMELECALRNAQREPTEINIRAGQVLHDQIEYLNGKMKTMHGER